MKAYIKYLWIGFTSLLIVTYSCEEDKVTIPCENNEVICLTIDKSVVNADGISTITLSATIPKEADEDKRTIKFKSGTGSFKAENDPENPSKAANADGEASVLLTVGIVPGEYKISASITVGDQTYEAEQTISLEPLTEAIKLSLQPNTIAADGQSKAILTANVPSIFYENNHKVTFSAPQAGDFGGTGETLEVAIDPNGQAIASLTVGNIPGEYSITARLDTEPPYTDIKILMLSPLTQVLSFDFGNIDPNLLIADNTTLVQVTTRVSNLNFLNKQLKLRTIGGWSFADHPNVSEVELPVNELGEISCLLKVGTKAESVALSASIDNISKTSDLFTLLPSYPDQILLRSSSETNTIKAINGTLPLQAFLLKNSGVVSEELIVNFEATQNNAVVGSFLPPLVKTDIEEFVSTEFRALSDTLEAGNTLTLKVLMKRNNNIIAQDSLIVQVLE